MTTRPTTLEVRRWAQALRLPVPDRGALPVGVVQRWNTEHPDRQYRSGTDIHYRTVERFSEAGVRGAAARWGA
jgi:hypothetical protein